VKLLPPPAFEGAVPATETRHEKLCRERRERLIRKLVDDAVTTPVVRPYFTDSGEYYSDGSQSGPPEMLAVCLFGVELFRQRIGDGQADVDAYVAGLKERLGNTLYHHLLALDVEPCPVPTDRQDGLDDAIQEARKWLPSWSCVFFLVEHIDFLHRVLNGSEADAYAAGYDAGLRDASRQT
jgi:hypothetical protein